MVYLLRGLIGKVILSNLFVVNSLKNVEYGFKFVQILKRNKNGELSFLQSPL